MKRFYILFDSHRKQYAVCTADGSTVAHASMIRGGLFRLMNGICEVQASGFSIDGDVLTFVS